MYIQATLSQGKAPLARAQAGAGWTREPTGVEASENRKISSLMHIEPRIVKPKGIDKKQFSL